MDPIEVKAEVVAGKKLAIIDNLEQLDAFVDQMIAPYVGAVIDPNDYEQVKLARGIMADLNKLKKPIEDQRKRVKRAYEQPLKLFEIRVRAITDKIDDARAELKAQVDEADRCFKEDRYNALKSEYESAAGVLADVIPFDAILDNKWLNRSTPEFKAVDALYDKVALALRGYNTLKEKQLKHRDEVLKRYAETLNSIAALELEDQLNKKDEELQRFKEARKAADAVRASRSEDRPNETVYKWSLYSDFEGTKEFAKEVAETLFDLGLRGEIKLNGEKDND